MTSLLYRRSIPNLGWLVGLMALCAVFGLTAGVSPKYATAGALGLGFVVAVFADLTLGVALFAVLSFLDLLSGGATVSFIKVAGLLLFVSWMISRASAPRQATAAFVDRHPALITAIVAFLAWNAVSVVWAQSSGAALGLVVRYLLDLLLLPIVFNAVRKPEHVTMIIGGFVLGAVISSVYGILNPASATAATAGRLSGGLGDPNYEAAGLVGAMVLAVGLAAVGRRSRILTLIAGGGLVLSFIGLVSTVSRGGLVAFGCVLVGGVIFGGRWRRSAAVLLLISATSVVGYFVVIASSTAVQRVTNASSSGRSDLWTVGWRMFEANPVLGVGASNFQLVSVHYLQRPGVITAAKFIVDTPKVAHNIYLEALATLGVPGLLTLLALLAAGASCALRAARMFERLGERDMELLSRCVVLALLAFLAANFFISDFLSKQLWLVFALCPAMLSLAHRSATRAAQHASRLDDYASSS